MNNVKVVRFALGYLAVVSAQIGFWALLAPRSFYDNFPGLGRAWVSIDGPYNEHLIRDVGALNLALVALFVAAMVWPSRQLFTVTAVAALVWSVPHLIYHLFNTEGLSGSDVAISLMGLAFFVLLAATLLASARGLGAKAP